MFDHIIEYVRNCLNYKSDIPVYLVFVAVIIFGLAKVVPRLFRLITMPVFISMVLSLPGFYAAPAFSKFLFHNGLIGQQWLRDQDLARDVGLGFIIAIVISATLLYEILSTIKELIRSTDPIYVLKTKRKEPSEAQYKKAPKNAIDDFLQLDNDFFKRKLYSSDINFILNSIHDEHLIKTAMGWAVIGLPVKRAVKKTLLDNVEPV